MKKVIFAIFILLLLAGIIAGCGTTSDADITADDGAEEADAPSDAPPADESVSSDEVEDLELY